MGRIDKNRQLRYQLIEERDNLYKAEFVRGEQFEYNIKIVNDKLDDISSRLEELSKNLYWLAKSNNLELDEINIFPEKVHKYSEILDEAMGNPMQELDKLFEVKK